MSRILFVCTAFAPKNVIGSVRPSKMAKYFVRGGHQVTAIAPPVPDDEVKDPMLTGYEMDLVRRIDVAYGGLHRAVRKRYLQSDARGSVPQGPGGAGGLKQFARFAFLMASDFFWARAAVKALKKACPDTGFDIIVSSYPNLGTHWAAGKLRRAGRGKFWIADFRDPLVYEWQNGLQKALNRRFQEQVEDRADAVTVVSKGAMAKFSRSAGKGSLHWVPNGFDPDDMAALSVPDGSKIQFPGGRDQLVLSYAGGLYGGKRDLSALFEALRSLVDSGRMREEDVLILYAGRDEGVLRAQAAPYRLENSIRSLGFVDRRTALFMQRHSDAILICSHNTITDQGIMTGKVYEALMLGKPLIALVNGDLPGSELGLMLKDIRAGAVYEEAAHEQDSPALAAYLLSLLGLKRSPGGIPATQDEEKKAGYTFSRISGRLLDIALKNRQA